MALTNIDNVLFEVKRYLKSCPVGGGIEIMSYKRNRTVAVILVDPETIILREKGYLDQEQTIPVDIFSKKIKPIMKREFPRSRKLRLHKFKDQSELDRVHQKI